MEEYRAKILKEQKEKFVGDNLAFLRAKRKMTFRVHALRLMDHKRHEFLHEMDEQDRIFQERRGKDAHNPMKINPHRV